jgi:hypothetical protein
VLKALAQACGVCSLLSGGKSEGFAIAADDWLSTEKLFSHRGYMVKMDMQSAIFDYFENLTDLEVTVKPDV